LDPAFPNPARSTDVYVWNPSGAPAIVELGFDVIDRLTPEISEAFRSLRRRGVETGGLLLGQVRMESVLVIRIADFIAVPSEHRYGPSYQLSPKDLESFDAACAKARTRSGAGLTLVGFYRSHTREGLGLVPEDLELLQERFAIGPAVALLVKPDTEQVYNAAFFLPTNGHFFAEPALLSFPFRRKDLGGGTSPEFTPQLGLAEPAEGGSARNRMLASHLEGRSGLADPDLVPEPRRAPRLPQHEFAASPPAVPPDAPAAAPRHPATAPPPPSRIEAAPAPLPPIAPPPRPATRSRRRVSPWAAVALVLLGLAIGGAAGYLYAVWARGELRPSDAAAYDYRLGLRAEVEPDAIKLSWDTASLAFRDARKGILLIEEDNAVNTVEIGAADLARGAVRYRTSAKQVNFRLDILVDERSGATERLEVTR
jgi:hypothetical protein